MEESKDRIDFNGLRVMLAKRKMTQVELSRVTGIRQPTISAICVGSVKHIPVSVLTRICKALDCQPGDLMEYVPEVEKE